jgi:hypothetical protein
MTRRPVARTLGAAAGGLLGIVFVPGAVAFADSLDVDSASASTDSSLPVTPVEPETVTGIYNMFTAPPGVNESLQGYGEFTANGDGLGTGTFDAYVSTSPYLAPYYSAGTVAPTSNDTSEVLYVDNQIPDAPASTDTALPNGSVISIVFSNNDKTENVYTSIPGANGTDTITDYKTNLVTGKTVDDSSLFQHFDASNPTPALPDDLTGVGDPTVTSVNGFPPLTMDLQGIQTFDYDANGYDGTFTGVETTTQDVTGFHTEAILVTADDSTGGGNPPPVGSVFNTVDFHNIQIAYSSIPQADGTAKITDILTNTATGNSYNLSGLYAGDDASAGLTDGSNVQSFWDGNGYTIGPAADAQETFTGINGLPPGNVSIQGTEEFSVYNSSGESVGTFDADVTTIPHEAFSNPVETLLVTSDGTGTVGTAPGDIPPVGSVFDVDYGSGNESVYSDLAATSSSGHDVISDWLVTPTLGNFDLTPFYDHTDASYGLGSGGLASYADTLWLDLFGNSSADAISNSAANTADALSAGVDPSAVASLADPFPHLEAALNLLAGLF